MRKLTLKNLLAHKRRLFSTFLAVVIGVAFLAGNLVLTDTIKTTFDDLFADVYRGTDGFVRSSTKIEGDFGATTRGRIDAGLLQTIAGVDGVAAAEPRVFGYAQIVGADGKTLGNPARGAPTVGSNWSYVDALNPFQLSEGRPPERDGEVVIDRKSAIDGKLRVGDRTQIITAYPTPVPVTVVGIAKFGSADSPGGASFALFTQAAAQKYVTAPGQVDGIAVVAKGGLSEEQLVARLQPVLPSGVEAVTAATVTEENQSAMQKGLSFFNVFMLIFAGIAVLVSVFSIYNTFSIIVAQRTREMALLRALGASKGQVRGSIIGEAVGLGVLASVVGLFAGIAVAAGLKAALAALGFDIPAGDLLIYRSTVIAALLVGVGVTVVASLVPARRASRVAPIAALREVAVEAGAASRRRVVVGLTMLALGVGAALGGMAQGSDGLSLVGLGATLLLVAFVVLGPGVARAAARIIGSPLPRLRGMAGSLARENAMRNPRRTSGTAAALMIGVAVVAVFTVFAASIKASVDDQLERSFLGDLVIDSQAGMTGGFNPQLAKDLKALPQVAATTGLRMAMGRIGDGDTQMVVLDPTSSQSIFDIGVTSGKLDDLGVSTVAVSKRLAEAKGWSVGTSLPALYPDGVADELTITALYENRDVIGTDFVLSPAAWEPHANDQLDAMILLKLAPDVSLSDGKAAVAAAVASFPNAKVQDRTEYQDTIAAQVNQILGLVYVMLALAIIIALMGIANTLSLSIHERTHELGLLRAVGETKGQLRAMVRWESVIIAVFGTVGGLGLGLFLSWALLEAAASEGFAKLSIPVGQLVAVLVVGAMAGVLAGVRPARRAAKLDVLRAISSE